MQVHEIIELNRLVEHHFGIICITPTHVFEIWHGSVKAHSKDAIYHMLAKTIKFCNAKMQCAQDNQEEFT